jgi:NADPH:quinone reductase-like Zn-dependent oxidoreductase
LAVAAGVEVVGTASPRNFAYVKRLGAREAFDYRAGDVEDRIVEWLRGKTVVGAFHAVGADGAVQACARIVDRSKGKAVVVSVRKIPDDGEGIPQSVRMKMSEFLSGRFLFFAGDVRC